MGETKRNLLFPVSELPCVKLWETSQKTAAYFPAVVGGEETVAPIQITYVSEKQGRNGSTGPESFRHAMISGGCKFPPRMNNLRNMFPFPKPQISNRDRALRKPNISLEVTKHVPDFYLFLLKSKKKLKIKETKMLTKTAPMAGVKIEQTKGKTYEASQKAFHCLLYRY